MLASSSPRALTEAARRLRQEIDFCFGAGAIEQRVAVRKTTEALDDFAMLLGVAQSLTGALSIGWRRFVTQLGEQTNRSVLIKQCLGVFEGHVEERAMVEFELAVHAVGNALAGGGQGERVRSECLRGTSMNLSGELIREHDECELAAGVVQPGVQFARLCRLQRVRKLILDEPVEGFIEGVPAASMGGIRKAIRQLAKPEIDYLLGVHGFACRNIGQAYRNHVEGLQSNVHATLGDHSGRAAGAA